MSSLEHINELDELHDIIATDPKVIVEFGASWCGPCRMFLPQFERFSDKHPEITCIKVDIDVDPKVVVWYSIQSVPQVMYFENGGYVKHLQSRTVIKLEQELGV